MDTSLDDGDVAEDLGATGNSKTGSKRPTKQDVDPDTPPLVVPTLKPPKVPKCGSNAGVSQVHKLVGVIRPQSVTQLMELRHGCNAMKGRVGRRGTACYEGVVGPL